MTLQEQNFISILSAAVQPHKIPSVEDPSYPEIIRIAEHHAVKSLLYPALKKLLPMGDPILAELKRQSFAAATRESMQAKDLSKIFRRCQEAKIPILPLKGCVIKDLYPYPELRFMSDADLLVPINSDKIMRTIMEEEGFFYHKVDAGDTDVYVSPLKLNYEIHLTLGDEGFSDKSRAFTKKLLEISRSKTEGSYTMALTPEDHYIYILIHFIKHFIYGGVGIRQLTDLFICYTKWHLDMDRVNALLAELELTQFHSNLKALWEHWFQEGPSTDSTDDLGDYILHSGVFGNEEQRATDRILSVGEDNNYIFRRLFPSFKVMKGFFPVLKKIPFALPFFWIWRAIRAVLFRRDKLSSEINALSTTKDDALEDRRQFYSRCGLSVYHKK